LLVALLATSMALNLGLAGLTQGGVEAFQDQSILLNLYEGRVLNVRPEEYLPFTVEVNLDSVPTAIACKPSGRAADLYLAGSLGEGASVLVAVDLESRTGVVIDLVYVKLLVEPEEQADEPSDGAGDSQDEAPADHGTDEGSSGEEPQGEPTNVNGEDPVDQTDDPAQSSQATVELLPGVELVVGVEPGPTPWLQAPDGKVKMTVTCQPSGVEGITVYPPPGVYFVDKDSRVLFSCTSENPGWVFREWCISRGSSGSTRKLGAGDDNLTRVLMNVDTVVTAFHSEIL